MYSKYLWHFILFKNLKILPLLCRVIENVACCHMYIQFTPLQTASEHSENTIKMNITVCLLYEHTKYIIYFKSAIPIFYTRGL